MPKPSSRPDILGTISSFFLRIPHGTDASDCRRRVCCCKVGAGANGCTPAARAPLLRLLLLLQLVAVSLPPREPASVETTPDRRRPVDPTSPASSRRWSLLSIYRAVLVLNLSLPCQSGGAGMVAELGCGECVGDEHLSAKGWCWENI